MSSARTTAQMRLNDILVCLTAAVDTLDLLSSNSNLAFLKPICVTCRALLTAVQTAKQNKTECTQLMERLHEILYGIIQLHIVSDTGTQLPPSTLNQIQQFTK
ncbi:hypothetical protein B0H13DRAFT_2391610 [Mycena leptocephala]|nr:hypothetical protein B0H13DRAFT_2391610 [Mycena leptocephala]